MITNGTAPPWAAALNTESLLMNPLVSGYRRMRAETLKATRPQRVSAAQPGPVGQRGVLVAVRAADQTHDGERADGAEAVGDQIEQRRRKTRGAVGDHAGENESDVRDRRIGQQSLDVGLIQRGDVATVMVRIEIAHSTGRHWSCSGGSAT